MQSKMSVIVAATESLDPREYLKLNLEWGPAICQGEAAEVNNGRGI